MKVFCKSVSTFGILCPTSSTHRTLLTWSTTTIRSEWHWIPTTFPIRGLIRANVPTWAGVAADAGMDTLIENLSAVAVLTQDRHSAAK